jgi:hypothetical protein
VQSVRINEPRKTCDNLTDNLKLLRFIKSNNQLVFNHIQLVCKDMCCRLFLV